MLVRRAAAAQESCEGARRTRRRHGRATGARSLFRTTTTCAAPSAHPLHRRLIFLHLWLDSLRHVRA